MDESHYISDDFIIKVGHIIARNEGNYGSINKDDNLSLSIGILQWHGYRAKNLLEHIVSKNVEQAKAMLSGTNIFNNINKSNDFWNTNIVNFDEAQKLSQLLTTKEGIDAQDELLIVDVKAYIEHGMRLGIKDKKILSYFADIENQLGPYIAEKIVQIAGGGEGLTMQKITVASVADPVLRAYKQRRLKTFMKVMNMIF